jgi:hypothetical protein
MKSSNKAKSKRMIKNLLLLTLTLIVLQVNGQNVLLFEDFNSGTIPVDFMTYDLDQNALDPAMYQWMPAYASFVGVNYMGSIFAGSPSLFTSPGTADKWMVTPAITLSDNSDTKTLRFDAARGDAFSTDGIEVYVSTSNTPADFSDSSALYSSTGIGEPFLGQGWGTRTIDITAYSGQTIHIGFRNNNYGQVVICIDNIEVIEQSGTNNVDEAILDNPINIYPNPTKDILNINGDYLRLEIYDGLGKLALSSTKKGKINVSDLTKGIYSLKIQTRDHLISKKLIIAE